MSIPALDLTPRTDTTLQIPYMHGDRIIYFVPRALSIMLEIELNRANARLEELGGLEWKYKATILELHELKRINEKIRNEKQA